MFILKLHSDLALSDIRLDFQQANIQQTKEGHVQRNNIATHFKGEIFNPLGLWKEVSRLQTLGEQWSYLVVLSNIHCMDSLHTGIPKQFFVAW